MADALTVLTLLIAALCIVRIVVRGVTHIVADTLATRTARRDVFAERLAKLN